MDNDALEKKIQEKGLDAPRVTPPELEAKIKDVEYVKHITPSGKVLRWAVLDLVNGFAVVGSPSVSVSVENDDEEVGEEVAYDNSLNEMWPLEGYLLQQKLFEEQ